MELEIELGTGSEGWGRSEKAFDEAQVAEGLSSVLKVRAGEGVEVLELPYPIRSILFHELCKFSMEKPGRPWPSPDSIYSYPLSRVITQFASLEGQSTSYDDST
ncbi:unnamed protein product [Allacma fusca]|uniref:Uncharacterized protein n=1 Tax=Allacma fusca TaxID=39272 RepID=A0A8J2PG29_9HEXA|nr:unnamed protein product [Allacma fusca]